MTSHLGRFPAALGVCALVLALPLGMACRCEREKPAAIRVDDERVELEELHSLARARGIADGDSKALSRLGDEIEIELTLAREARQRGLDAKPELAARLGELRRRLLVKALEEDIAKKVANPEALQRWYSAHQDELSREEIEVSHIVVRLTKDADDAAAVEARRRIGLAYQALREKTPIETVAKAHGDVPAGAARPGYVGRVWEGRTHPEFVAAALKLKKGEFTEPIRTEFGLHIVYAHGDAERVAPPFESVSGEIRRRLIGEKRAELLERLRRRWPATRALPDGGGPETAKSH